MSDHLGAGDFCRPHGQLLPCEECERDSGRQAAAERQREQTAATILAALVKESGTDNCHVDWVEGGAVVTKLGAGSQRLVAYAVALADALRARLGEGG